MPAIQWSRVATRAGERNDWDNENRQNNGNLLPLLLQAGFGVDTGLFEEGVQGASRILPG